jgi:hypothetical protein
MSETKKIVLYSKTKKEVKRWLKKFCEWELEIDDWCFLKHCLFCVLTDEFTKKPFSKRNFYREVWMNPFEVEIADYWFKLTGVRPVIKPTPYVEFIQSTHKNKKQI